MPGENLTRQEAQARSEILNVDAYMVEVNLTEDPKVFSYVSTVTFACSFFGDGATAQGLLYEVMNMAALWKLPVIYACENNGYSEYTTTEEIAAGKITARAEAFGIEAHQVDGQDVLAVNALAQKLVQRARKGEGPFFIELMTYRYHGHHVGDINRAYYRTKEEEFEWKENRDPIKIMGQWLASEGIASESELKVISDTIYTEANEAVEYALAAAYPDVSEVTMHVYAEAS